MEEIPDYIFENAIRRLATELMINANKAQVNVEWSNRTIGDFAEYCALAHNVDDNGDIWECISQLEIVLAAKLSDVFEAAGWAGVLDWLGVKDCGE